MQSSSEEIILKKKEDLEILLNGVSLLPGSMTFD